MSWLAFFECREKDFFSLLLETDASLCGFDSQKAMQVWGNFDGFWRHSN
jgi:hypothetical protein